MCFNKENNEYQITPEKISSSGGKKINHVTFFISIRLHYDDIHVL